MTNFTCVVGARPNYMKMAPVVAALKGRGIEPALVHTGQHYDESMSTVFFDELGMPKPSINLDVGSDTHTRQTARVMVAFEEYCQTDQPDLVLVGGDVNSTAAVALVCAKLGIRLGHVESGLRSFDRSMPEEVNRVVTDHLADLLFTTEASADENLRAEGIRENRIHFVGNTMIDSLNLHLEAALGKKPWLSYGFREREYAVVTLHRPSNVDEETQLRMLMDALKEISKKIPLIYPVHPRTQARLEDFGLIASTKVRFCPPLPYLEFLGLMARARCVLTDSGGIQEETTALGIPCLTIRENTERPVTVSHGSNRLVGVDPENIVRGFQQVLNEEYAGNSSPPLWDGHAAERIADVILS